MRRSIRGLIIGCVSIAVIVIIAVGIVAGTVIKDYNQTDDIKSVSVTRESIAAFNAAINNHSIDMDGDIFGEFTKTVKDNVGANVTFYEDEDDVLLSCDNWGSLLAFVTDTVETYNNNIVTLSSDYQTLEVSGRCDDIFSSASKANDVLDENAFVAENAGGIDANVLHRVRVLAMLSQLIWSIDYGACDEWSITIATFDTAQNQVVDMSIYPSELWSPDISKFV